MNLRHGESIISVDADIILVKEKGAYNREGILKELEELILIIESFAEKEFKLFIDCMEMEGATPDAYDEINKFNIWLNNKHMVAKALLVNSPINSTIQYSRIPAIKSQNVKSFYDRSQAINWLNQQSSLNNIT